MSSHPTSKARRKRQKRKQQYARLREDCQLAGVIETTPEGAVRNEVAPVAPDPPLPHLVRAAIRNGWATTDAGKAKVVGDMIAAFFGEGTDATMRVQLFRTLLLADRTQYECDRAEEADEGGPVVLNFNFVSAGRDAPDAEHPPLPSPRRSSNHRQ
jgi:hypothetical protein